MALLASNARFAVVPFMREGNVVWQRVEPDPRKRFFLFGASGKLRDSRAVLFDGDVAAHAKGFWGQACGARRRSGGVAIEALQLGRCVHAVAERDWLRGGRAKRRRRLVLGKCGAQG